MTTTPASRLTGARSLDAAILRLFAGPDHPVGMGFLVADDLALTCAHVVAAAVGIADGAEPPTDAEIEIDLPLLGARHGRTRATAGIERWVPTQDVAVLRLTEPVQGARPIRLINQPENLEDLWGHPARAFGVPAGHPGGVWHSGVLRAGQAEGWVELDRDGDGHRIAPGFSGSPVWDDTLAGVVGIVVVAERGQTPAGSLIPTEQLVEAWPELRDLIKPPSPFRSLKPFEESDREVFHGRQADSERVARAVSTKRITTLIGPSGCGKSSLVRAGVIPLRRVEGDIPILLQPARGSSPLHALAAKLIPLFDPEEYGVGHLEAEDRLVARLARDGLHDIVPEVLKCQHGARLLIVIDQFEDLLDLPDDAVRALAAVLAGQRPPKDVAVLATLRSDFVEPVQAAEHLRPLISSTFDSLPPMNADQLREAITKPVAKTHARFEDGLVEQVIADAGGEPRALPLLAFALDQLWRKQQGAALTFHAYRELGGVHGALSDYADRAWSNLAEEDKPAARRLLSQLVRMPIGAENAARRIVPRAELDAARWRVAQRLAAARLIVLNTAPDTDPADALAGVESVELAHEVLITAWDELKQQVGANETFLIWREALRHDLARWQDADNAPDRLPALGVLNEAREKWLPTHADDLTEPERDYIERGWHHHRSRAHRRRALIGVLSALVLVAGAAGVITVRTHQDAAQKAAVVRSGTLAADSQALLASDPGLAAQLAVAAFRSSPTQAATTALYSALQAPLLDNVLATTRGTVERIAAQANGPLAAAVDLNGTIRVWNLGNPARPILSSIIQTAGASGIAFTPHAPLLAAECSTPGLCLWNLADTTRPVTEARLPIPIPGPWHISSMAISPDGKLLAAASERGYTLLWSIVRPAHPALLVDLPDPSADTLFAAAAFSPNGSFLAETHQNGTTSLWSLAKPAAPTRIATINSGYQDIAIDSTGTLLVGASDDNLDLWNIRNPAAPTQIPFFGPGSDLSVDLESLSISPDGRTLAFGGTSLYATDSEFCLLDLADFAKEPGSANPTCQSTGFSTYTMAYTSSGALMTGGLDHVVRLWRASPALITNATIYSPDSTPVVSAGGHYMVAAITDLQKTSAMGIWNLDASGGPALAGTIPLPSVAAAYAAFLDTNIVLTETHDGNIQIWNISDPRHPRQTASLGNVGPNIDGLDGMGPPNGIGSSKDLLAVLGGDGVMHLWHVGSDGTATERGTFTDPAAGNGQGSILPEGNTVFMTTKTGIDWWDISNPARPTETGSSPLAHADQGGGVTSSGGVFAAATPPDVTGAGSTLNLYHLADGHVLSTATVSHSAGVVLGLSDDGHLLAASGLSDNGLSLWNTTDARTPQLASSLVTAFDLGGVTFSDDDKMMADWTQQSVQLWDTHDPAAPTLVGSFNPTPRVGSTTTDEQVRAAGFAQGDGSKLVISTGSDGPSLVYVLDTHPNQAADQLCSIITGSITPTQWAQDAPGVPYQNPCSR